MRCMTAAVLAFACLDAGLVAASAADLPAQGPVYKAPAMVVVPHWGGIYVGGQAGGAWASSNYTVNNGSGIPESINQSASSFIGGGHIGVQGQFDNFVLGAEGGFSWTDLTSTTNSVLFPGRTRTIEDRNIGSVVGKVGYAIDNWLIYAKGGWATSDIRTSGLNPATGVMASVSKWESGYTVGGGIDYQFAPNWIAGVDFNYYNFAFNNRTAPNIGGTGLSTWTNGTSNVYAVTGRLSYLFSWSPPLMVRY
jgi:outer membrane immunogenic protein